MAGIHRQKRILNVMSLAFLFPGQGAQYVGMASDLYKASPIAQYVFNLTDRISETGLKTFCFDGPEESLKQTAITQPAIFAHSISVFEILKDRGIHPDFVAGHSVGELSALVAAGVMSLEDGVRIVGIRGRAMHAAGKMHPGTMAAIIGLSDSAVADLCQSLGPNGMVVPANFNCPGQVVISGEPTAIKRAMRKALEEGARRVVELAVSGAFHSGLMRTALGTLAGALANVPFSPARIPVVPNTTAEPTTDPDLLKDLLVRQVVSPVRWTDSMARIVSEGVDRAIEAGPGSTLKALMRRIEKRVAVSSVGTLDDLESLTI